MAFTASSSNPLDLQSNPPDLPWDAFISFRGKDIRYGLLSHLAKAFEEKKINAFIDDKLPKGEEISQALLEIIENSYVSVVIFSENYADSPWCLDELVKILECRETLEQIVLPVFYKVDPTDVQELKGSFGEAFHKLKEKRQDQHKVDGWSQALDKISNLSGWDSRNIKSESELVEAIVNGVWKELSPMPSNDFSNEGLCLADSGRDMASQVRAKPPTSSLLPAETVLGREEDKQAILDLLKDEASNAKVSVIPIVGMGGVGKTTLAQLIYNDRTLHFDLKAWVCIGEEFDIYGITQTLLKKVGSYNSSSPQEKLKEKLSGKKFLIVLDDVWMGNYEDWTLFHAPFVVGAPGSTLIVTTRSQEVSSMMKTVPSHNLKELSYDDCLSVFAQHALGETNFDKHVDLEEMGNEIVKRCQGLPLAAKALGGLLRGKPNPTAWRYVVKSEIWDLPDDKCNILPALRLSYLHLPSHLKTCFAYCAIFPKDYEFDSKELVLLWMAEGFLYRPKGKMQMEELGDQYFCDLLSRSFFQRSSSNKLLYVMHDLINDLARSISGERCFQLGDKLEDAKSYAKVYHSSFLRHFYDFSERFEVFYKMRSLRTFLALPISKGFHYLSRKVLHDLVPNLKCLRTLSLSCNRFKELPNSIGALKHLRYLNLSRTAIEKLPESVCELFNLQTLILHACEKLVELPKDMQNLINLRYLDISNTESLKAMPVQVGNLTNLYMLPKFVVCKGNGLGINMLKKLSHLQGQLRITGLQNVVDVRDADFAILKEKRGLKKLGLEWFHDFSCPRNVNCELEVLNRLQPHHNLSSLEIKWFGGVVFPFWIADRRFNNMVQLKLCNCRKVTSLPPLGRLPSLKVLSIIGMDELKEVGVEFYEDISCFACLETLIIQNMFEWERWSWSNGLNEAGTEQFPNLRRLNIENCPKLVGELPNCLPSLESLLIWECPQVVDSPKVLPSLSQLHFQSGPEVNLINMSNISSLTSLTIWGISGLVSLPEALIEALVALEEFTICKCDELAYLWRDGTNLDNLARLKSLEIENCKELVCLVEGEEGILPCNLQVLKIRECNNLEKLPNGLHCLTSLRVLWVTECCKLLSSPEKGLPYSLTKIMIPWGEFWRKGIMWHGNDSNQMSQLEELRINGYPSFPQGEFPNSLKFLELFSCTTQLLESLYYGLPHLTDLRLRNVSEFPESGLPIPSLVSLQIFCCNELRSLPNQMQCLKSLQNLHICYCPLLESFPESGLPIPTLTHLRIIQCEKLRSLPDTMQNLTSLQFLSIYDLDALLSFPEGGLPYNLSVLSIESCKNFIQPISEWGLNRLRSLRELRICGPCPSTDMVVSFPDNDGLQLPTSLTEVYIYKFKNLQSISRGIQRLTSLQKLYISKSLELQSLPKEGLPATLGHFETEYSSLLKVRCLKDKGDLWPIIADIPFIDINY